MLHVTMLLHALQQLLLCVGSMLVSGTVGTGCPAADPTLPHHHARLQAHAEFPHPHIPEQKTITILITI